MVFDWGDTLTHATWDDESAHAAATAGLAALARRELPDPGAIVAWWRRADHQFDVENHEDEIDLLATQTACFADLGVAVDDDEVSTYVAAVHRIWKQTEVVSEDAHALLDALRDRGLQLAIVSNVSLPAPLVHETLEEQGFADRVDAVVLSCEVGKRKPHPLIFERALAELAVEARDAVFVGDRVYNDVLGASRAGMRTVQALWFYSDELLDGVEPDARAFTMFDVLNIVDSLASQ